MNCEIWKLFSGNVKRAEGEFTILSKNVAEDGHFSRQNGEE
jgi:hypothetical protein